MEVRIYSLTKVHTSVSIGPVNLRCCIENPKSFIPAGVFILMSPTLWTWERCGEHILSLKNRLGFSDTICFLEFCVRDDGTVHDLLRNTVCLNPESLYWILTHYGEATSSECAHELIPYDKLPGGYAFYGAFRQATITPLMKAFGEAIPLFERCCLHLKGSRLAYGDCSYEIHALPLIPITITLWEKTEEFDARCSVFYDTSASHYLPTEDLAHLGELLSRRLITVSEVLP